MPWLLVIWWRKEARYQHPWYQFSTPWTLPSQPQKAYLSSSWMVWLNISHKMWWQRFWWYEIFICVRRHHDALWPQRSKLIGLDWPTQWRHQAITWNNVDVSSIAFSDIHLRAFSQYASQSTITKIRLQNAYNISFKSAGGQLVKQFHEIRRVIKSCPVSGVLSHLIALIW